MQRALGGALKHGDCTELMVDYVAGRLDPDVVPAFQRHMELCAVCLEETALQKAVWAALDECHLSMPAAVRAKRAGRV